MNLFIYKGDDFEESGKFAPPIWDQINRLFDFVDQIRYAGSVGGESEELARASLKQWVIDVEKMIRG